MSRNTESNTYTVLFAVAMVIIVGSLLAFVAQSLKGKIAENKRIEKQQNILYAMGVNENEKGSVNFIPKDKVDADFSKYIVKQYVIKGTTATENDKAYLIDLKREAAKAKKPSYTRKLPLFVGEKDNKTYYIIPVRGKGLWDAIWGYIALNKDLIVQGVYFDDAGETPGLGGNIKERFFMDEFIGEHIFKGNTFEGITVFKGNDDPKSLNKTDCRVDAMAGATITGNGVTAMIKKGLQMYVPYLETLKQ
ncbi:Na(+)-translocating NADH-quinone reductase subunit C [Lutibacter sp.]|uniref:Na(+)-translocating NADH-quinone reductase subunit C n=1 Tax=Lutibacter sp. TaxID=1925666 RepID=UPI0025C49425|nr:Na(+)-translocating NADH-quinone reductase subunit C [Lutibacter sp.]MCF6181316.1 Na(+)-translocating NADH-quinone reductase subunit C [Lutibacter sp.]